MPFSAIILHLNITITPLPLYRELSRILFQLLLLQMQLYLLPVLWKYSSLYLDAAKHYPIISRKSYLFSFLFMYLVDLSICIPYDQLMDIINNVCYQCMF